MSKTKLNFKVDYLVFGLIFVLIGIGVWSNVQQQQAVDNSKLPSKVEEDRGFQRWITNLKNNDVNVTADEFTLKEENEIYNTKWIKVTSIEAKGAAEEFDSTIEAHKDVRYVAFSPSEREFIDYRHEIREAVSPNGNFYQPNEVRFYGQKEDKIIEARILDCSLRANCYFDRAYFLSNDLFIITEFSRDIDKKDVTTPECALGGVCTYTIKLHLIDLINNSRWVYESNPVELVLEELIPEL